VAIDYFNWLGDMLVPDEAFFSTMYTVQVLPDGTVVQDLTRNYTLNEASKF